MFSGMKTGSRNCPTIIGRGRDADSTYIWAREGWLYVGVAVDRFSRRAVSCQSAFVADALMLRLAARQV